MTTALISHEYVNFALINPSGDIQYIMECTIIDNINQMAEQGWDYIGGFKAPDGYRYHTITFKRRVHHEQNQ